MRDADDDFARRDTADREFHLRIAEITRNGALAHVVAALWEQRRGELWTRIEKHFHTPELRARTIEDHAAIVDCARGRRSRRGARRDATPPRARRARVPAPARARRIRGSGPQGRARRPARTRRPAPPRRRSELMKTMTRLAAALAVAAIALPATAKEFRSADVHPDDYPTVMAVKIHERHHQQEDRRQAHDQGLHGQRARRREGHDRADQDRRARPGPRSTSRR